MTSNPHAWHLSDLVSIPQNGLKVMTTFSCGGGSSMGYKLAGYDVIAANDIDPQMQWHYETNLHPQHYFLCPIRDLLTRDLPEELFHLDILDGSPPCSTFSTSGNREKDWGKKKHFREGQAEQVLSDLFFDYLDLVERLRPKVVIAENVKGMLLGNAKGYVRMIVDRLRQIGYATQVFLIDAADCGVPQRRERTIFMALRTDIQRPRLVLQPRIPWISTEEATSDLQTLTGAEVEATKPSPQAITLWPYTKPGKSFGNAKAAKGEKVSDFSRFRIDPKEPVNTLVSHCGTHAYHWDECRCLTMREILRLGSFPDDYQVQSKKLGSYLVGMSVPPKMMQFIAAEVGRQWLT